MDPEYQAAQRAYMRYHNMNPIFGISSKYVLALFVVVACACCVFVCLISESIEALLSKEEIL
jgi:hypothetical protein